MRIRMARDADKTAIAHLHRASIRRQCGAHYDPAQLEGWLGNIEPAVYDHALREKIFLVAERNGGLLGFAMLDIDGAEVNAIYISPEAVGTGIGSHLLAELERRATEQALTKLTVHATLNAEGFYGGRGYERVGEAVHTLPNGTHLPCIEMVKVLTG